jgi:hypothetical protein
VTLYVLDWSDDEAALPALAFAWDALSDAERAGPIARAVDGARGAARRLIVRTHADAHGRGIMGARDHGRSDHDAVVSARSRLKRGLRGARPPPTSERPAREARPDD